MPRLVFGPHRIGDYKKFGVPTDTPPAVESRDARVDFIDATNQEDGILSTLYVEKGPGVVRPARLHLAVSPGLPTDGVDPATWLASAELKAAIDINDEVTYQVLAPPPPTEGIFALQTVLEFAE